MKKFICVIALLLVTVLLGTGCGELSKLSFTENAWNGQVPTPGTTETLKYSVKLDTEYKEGDYDFKREAKVPSSLHYNIEGEYVTETAVYSITDEEVKDLNKEIIDDSKSETVIYLHTTLNLTATYDINGEEKAFDDVIDSKTYMLNTANGLAPIRSERNYRYTTVNATANEGPKIGYECGRSIINYFKTEYTATNTTLDYDTGNVLLEGTFTEKYKYGTLIDYTATLFALRNTTVEMDKSATIPAASFAYIKYQTLAVKCYSLDSFTKTVIYKGATVENVNFPARSYEYRINAQNSGRKQLAVIQSGSKGDIPNRALLLKYVEPLTEYGSYLCLGALVYQLEEISVNV